MKSHPTRMRVLRRLAIAGSVAALAVPTSASAMIPNDPDGHRASAPPSITQSLRPSVSAQETVADNSGRTLAFGLAAVSLAVALGTVAVSAVRATQVQRHELSRH